MQRIPVSSSNLKSVGYDPVAKILEIKFLSGSIYQYSGVPQNIYDGLMKAAFPASFLVSISNQLVIAICRLGKG